MKIEFAAFDAIVALQAENPGAQRRARQARRRRGALDAHDRRAPAAPRADLESLQNAAAPTWDEGLDEIVREIDTRQLLELATLDRMLRRA